jgi:hypothetical protein
LGDWGKARETRKTIAKQSVSIRTYLLAIIL